MASRGVAVGGRINQRNRASNPGRQLQSSLRLRRAFGVGIMVLLGILQLHFPNSSPIESYPANMWTALFAGFLCCIALVIDITSSSRSLRNICVQIACVSGLLTFAAVLSVVVPPSFEPFIFVIWMVASTMFVNVTRSWIFRVAKMLFHFAKNAVSNVHSTWKRIIGNNDNNVAATTLPV